LINAASFVAVLISLIVLRTLPLRERPTRARGSLLEGFRYVLGRDDLKAVLLMLFLIGTFGLNFPIFISTMSVSVFHAGAGAYGLLTSMMAAGSVIGALMVAARPRPGIRVLLIGALFFGLGCAAAAAMPNYASFGIALMLVGIAAQTVTTSTNSFVQTSTEHGMRGRVIAILLAIVLGGTPVGAPIIGWIADAFGPRWALGVAAASGVLAALVAFIYLALRQSADARAR
jgi:predicted MFS family arabinose efflux permease